MCESFGLENPNLSLLTSSKLPISDTYPIRLSFSAPESISRGSLSLPHGCKLPKGVLPTDHIHLAYSGPRDYKTGDLHRDKLSRGRKKKKKGLSAGIHYNYSSSIAPESRGAGETCQFKVVYAVGGNFAVLYLTFRVCYVLQARRQVIFGPFESMNKSRVAEIQAERKGTGEGAMGGDF